VILDWWPLAAADGRFLVVVSRAFRLPGRCGGVPRAPGGVLSTCRDLRGWLAGCESLEAGDRGGYLLCPGPPGGDPEPEAAAAADQAPGCGEQPQPEPFGFPAAGGAGEGEHLGPGEQLAGQHRDRAERPRIGGQTVDDLGDGLT